MGEAEECVDDDLAALVAALKSVERIDPGVGALDRPALAGLDRGRLATLGDPAVPILANRAATVADAIGTRGGSDAENLREVVRRMRGGTA